MASRSAAGSAAAALVFTAAMREYDLPSTRRKGTTLVVPKGDYTRGALAPEANRRQEFELVLYFPSVAEATFLSVLFRHG